MKKQSGFTLIEIAIVLVIIGLLTGGVLKGQEMITNAKVRNLITQMDGLKVAVLGFQDRYRTLPGDSSTAAALIGNGAVNCATNCDNGLIQPWPNTSLVTNHLSSAGFYAGAFATAETNATPTTQNAPANPWGGPIFVAYWNQYYNVGAATSRNGVYTGRSIPSSIMAEIDRKVDDGTPQTGTFRSAWPTTTTATCVTGNAWVTANGGADCTGVQFF